MTTISRLIRWARNIDARTGDVLLAALAAVLAVVGVYAQPAHEDLKEPTALVAFVALLACVPMLWRRRAPIACLAASTILTAAIVMLEYPEGLLPVVLLVLTYTVGAYSPMPRAWLGLAIAVVTILTLAATDTPGLSAPATVENLAVYTCAWVVGLVIRSRRAETAARLSEALERAESHRLESARAVAEERLRIAQELHDVVAHSMSVIAVQAGVGAHVLDTQPDEARRSLEAISKTSRSTLNEMRRLLGVLRGEDGQRSHEPAPGLADVDGLVKSVEATGVDVSLEVTGDLTSVPGGVDLSAYRVVQEALTNVIKHAGAGVHAQVSIDCRDHEVCIEVLDDGRGAAVRATAASGHGLVGMQERVAVWGGELSAGPRRGGGFRVAARIPFGDEQ